MRNEHRTGYYTEDVDAKVSGSKREPILGD